MRREGERRSSLTGAEFVDKPKPKEAGVKKERGGYLPGDHRQKESVYRLEGGRKENPRAFMMRFWG